MENFLVLLDSKDVEKSIAKGIVKGFLAVCAIHGVAKYALKKIEKKLDEDKKASEVEEVTDENSDEE